MKDGASESQVVHVLGAWDDGGVFARADASGIVLLRYHAGRVEPFAARARFPAP